VLLASKGSSDTIYKPQLIELEEKLTTIHFNEMVPYYLMRYGFYEGHTDYRADPIAIAYIFGLKSIEEIEHFFPGNLYQTLTQHFTRPILNESASVNPGKP
jgi:hypothetical protein